MSATHDPMGQPHELVEHNRIEHYLILGSKGMALSGGMLFVALIGMSLVSIVGRKTGFGSVTGDIELMQAGTAVAAGAFLPYCTLLGEHLKVDFFTESLRAGLKRSIDGFADLLLALFAALLAWRTGLAALSLHDVGEVTPLVSLPVWIPVAALVPSLAMMGVCAAYRFVAAFSSRKMLVGGEA
ncbi:TRAP transporter small permease subunit [Azoarcus sp. L1K30]|uniref:TRAP transporter small permease n=1 Tax=Azoarcus sp. L1K30 TaxID=2820277 RepID=UPI001B8332CB|nr:TRAP transporter small permease [Azoarcus sp. L1K30]MBR0567068.1 TRAP transporter small permease subunit [Azoarcus sp. L1K30]